MNLTQLNIIEIEHRGSVEGCCSAMLEQWLDRSDASWERLKEALEAVELYHLANTVSKRLLPTY